MSTNFPYPNQPLPWPSGPQDLTGDNNLGLSTNDVTQRYVLGTRFLAWDGSVYKYCKAGATLTSYQAGVHTEGTGAAVSYESLPGGEAAGSSHVTITQGSITENQYTGGYILIFHATGNGQVYGIRSNDATAGTITKLYLDRPLAVAVTSSDSMELYANPYSTISQANTSGGLAFIGVPMALLTDTYYGWVKTRGPAFVSPQSTVGNAYVGEGAYWRHDGSVDVVGNSGSSPVTSQYAGYVMVGDAANDGPLIMLQGSF